MPSAVVFPGNTEEVAKVLRLAWIHRVPVVGRGSGTSLSGGALALNGGLLISMTRMNRIIEVSPEDEVAVVEAGVINSWVNDALSKLGLQYPVDPGYFYAPDPGSQRVSTIGGNVNHNSGGVKCFKYGVTVNNVRGLEVVLPNGEVRLLGGKAVDYPGYDLAGIVVGSEGTLGIVTKVILRIIPSYEYTRTMLAAFSSVEDAGKAVANIVGSGIRPVAIELMDKLAVEDVESGPWAGGLPRDAEAILLIDVEGSEPGTGAEVQRIVGILRNSGAYMVRVAKDRAEASKWWGARKQAFGSVGFVGPNYVTEDGTIPRKRLPEALRRVREIVSRYGLRVANVFHAGDGNLHPLILYDERRGEKERALLAGEEILRMCVELGGTITGEHGVGYHKRKLLSLIYTEQELEIMRAIKGVFDEVGIMNPGKIFPR
jgi:glycolate oxidase